MYHAHFRGTHYEAGFRWGSLLLKHKNIILENIPFEITQERIDYALSCLPLYELSQSIWIFVKLNFKVCLWQSMES